MIADLLLKYEKSSIAVLPQLGECLQLVQDPKGIAAIVWMIGEYGQVCLIHCPLYNAMLIPVRTSVDMCWHNE